MSNNKWWNTRKSKLILKLDYAYIDPLVANYSGDNCVTNKGEFAAGSFQPKPEFTCELCVVAVKKDIGDLLVFFLPMLVTSINVLTANYH